MGITQILEGSMWWTRTALVIACGTLIAGASEDIAPDNVSLVVVKEPGWCFANGQSWAYGGHCVKSPINTSADCWKIGIKNFHPLAAMEYSGQSHSCTLHTWKAEKPSNCPETFTARG